jgi:hypothetical protein
MSRRRHGRGRHPRWSERRGHGSGFIAAAGDAQTIERLIGFVEGFMSFSEPQQNAWNTLAAVLREQSAHIQQALAAADTTGQNDGAPSAAATLLRLERMLSSTLEAVGRIRPVFENFYATLDEKQQKALDEYLT